MPRVNLNSMIRLFAGALIPAAALAACDSPTDVRQTEPAVAAVSVLSAPASLTVGQAVNLNVRVEAADGTVLQRAVIWTTSDSLVATVSSGGMLVARSAGLVEVRAASAGKHGSAEIRIVNGTPTATQLQPAGAMSGGEAFELSVVGTGFAPGATVLWNGAARPTRVISATEVRADIAAADLEDAGLASVVVTNPSTAGDPASARLYFTIQARPVEPPQTIFRLVGLEDDRTLPVEVSRTPWVDAAGVAHAAVQRAVAGTLKTTYDSSVTEWQLVVTIATYLESTGAEVDRDNYTWWGSLEYDMWTGNPVLHSGNLPMILRTNALSETELVIYQVIHTNGEPTYEKAWLYVKQ